MDKLSTFLPKSVIQRIGDHFAGAVIRSQAHYEYSSADEDALTGALGDSLIHDREIFSTPEGTFVWSTYYRKIRGRGPGAPEKTLGADGIFQIDVLTEKGQLQIRKGLVFQAKNRWSGRDGRLVEQVRTMNNHCPSSVVIDYSPDRYSAVASQTVIEADGERTSISPDHLKGLAELLCVDFLECTQGEIGLGYDPENESLVWADGDLHMIVTEVFSAPPTLEQEAWRHRR